jgi:hypothetical protein
MRIASPDPVGSGGVARAKVAGNRGGVRKSIGVSAAEPPVAQAAASATGWRTLRQVYRPTKRIAAIGSPSASRAGALRVCSSQVWLEQRGVRN